MLIYFHYRKEITYCFIFMIIHSIQKIIQNYLVTNNAKILKGTSQISIIIIFIIQFQLSKEKEEKNKRVFKTTENNLKKLKDKGRLIILIIISLVLDFLAYLIILPYSIRYCCYYGDIIIGILIERFFSKKFYHHHLFSIIFYLFILLYILIMQFNSLFSFILFFPKFLYNCYSFFLSLFIIKYLNTEYYVSTYLCGSLIGLERFIRELSKHKLNLNFKQKNNSLYINIFYYFSRFLYYYLYYYIIEKFNPFILIISETFLILFFKFFPISSEDENVFNYTFNNDFEVLQLLLITFITFFSFLIYIEVLELNFCNLNKNIKNRIYERGNSEIRDSNHLIDESLEEIEISLKI